MSAEPMPKTKPQNEAEIAPLPKTAQRSERGVTFRAVALGSLLIPFNAYSVVRLEKVLFGPYPSTISLFANVIFVLFVLAGLNSLLARFAPRFTFSQGELLTLYTMLAISTGLAGLDGVGAINQTMAHGGWFGAARHWDFLGAFPRWLTISDSDALKGHFLGASTLYRAETLRAWLVPVGAWTVFVTQLLFVAQCVNVLVRRQWADRERLTFPIVWLPLAMTEGGTGTAFFENRLMWSGFAVAAGISLWNGLAFLYPSIPALPIGTVDLKPFLTAKPWSAIDWMPLTFYPLAIGLGYLLPLDLLFSCWFFFLFWKMQVVFSNAAGWDATPDFPFIKEQGFGAVLGLFGFYLWSGRKYYREILRSAWRRPPVHDAEARLERAALFGVIGGMLGLTAFCLAAGVTWWVIVAFFALSLPMLIVVTRIRAELGAPVHDFHFMGPDAMLPRVLGTSSFRPGDFAFFTFAYGLTRAHRSDTMPIGLESLQMARMRNFDARRMFGVLVLATVLGAVSAFWAFEHQAYTFGAATKFHQGFGMAQEAFGRTEHWTSGSLDARPNHAATGAMGVGLLTTLALFAMRLRFLGFPLHPIGYAISSSWAIHLIWMPLLIAWVLKSLTMRYGGLRAYRVLLPFFLGLILGDCVMGSAWGLLSLLGGIQTYNFFGS